MTDEVSQPRRIMPPAYFGGALALMLLLHFLLSGPTWLGLPWGYVGIPLIGAGATLAVVGSRLFEKRGTTIKPFEESSVLVLEGPFRYSRNPMYLGMVLILLGLALLLGTLTPVLVVPVFVVLLRLRFIHAEEAALERTFGQEYRDYRSRVRRWFGRRAS